MDSFEGKRIPFLGILEVVKSHFVFQACIGTVKEYEFALKSKLTKVRRYTKPL